MVMSFLHGYAGQCAALGTAVCWGFNAMMFTNAGRKVGSDTVTHVRLWLALILLGIVHFSLYGTIMPWHAEFSRVGWLALSGAVGFVLGDIFLFEAFVLIGTARSLVIKTLAPALAAFLGWIFMHEVLHWMHLLSMVMTLGGISLVVFARIRSEKEPCDDAATPWARGIFYAFLGAVGQAVGVVLSKQGLDGDFSPISATLLRVAAGAVTMLIVALFRGRVRVHVAALRNVSGMMGIVGGTILGPVIGVSLSLFALQRTQIGIASTLMEMAPVVVLLTSVLLFNERVGWREWVGTLVAVGGAATLFI